MEQAYLLLAVVLVLFLPAMVEAIPCICADDAVNIRAGASTNAKKIHVLYPGECLPSYRVIEYGKGYKWHVVDFKHRVAFVAVDWTIIKNCTQSELHPTSG